MSALPMMAANLGGSHPSLRKMSFYELQDRFWEMEAEQKFSPAQVKLYFWWLNQFNQARWPASIPRTVKQVAALLSMDDKTVDASRVVLQQRGLLAYTAGNANRSAVWALSYDSPEADRKFSGQLSPLSPEVDRNISGQLPPNTPTFPEADRKFSAPIRNKKKNSSGVEEEERDRAAPRAAEKKIEGARVVQFNLPSDEPNASAPHTRGGAAPANLEPDELPARPVAPADESQPDDEYHRWVARPRDVEMVDAYLTRIGHPKAGKGHLFFDYYTSVGWVSGQYRMPCQNWKALLKSFKFFESNASASNRNRPTGSNDARGRLHIPATISFDGDEA